MHVAGWEQEEWVGEMHVAFLFWQICRNDLLDGSNSKSMSITVSMNGGTFSNLFFRGMGHSLKRDILNDASGTILSIHLFPE